MRCALAAMDRSRLGALDALQQAIEAAIWRAADSHHALIVGQKSPEHVALETEYPEESVMSH
jgi:hypothetical protein